MARKSGGTGRIGRLIALVPEDVRQKLRTFVVRLAVASAIVTILCCMAILIRRHVAASPRFQVDATSLVPRQLPRWAGPLVRRELTCLPGLPERFSIMETGICRKVAEAFEKNPWVDEVISVSRVFPNRMAVSLKLRRPVAGVRCDGRYYLVDAEGRRLTEGIRRWPRTEGGLPIIMTRVQGLPERGAVWDDELVRGGASVAGTLMKARGRLKTHFTRIDMTNFNHCRDWRYGDVHLIADSGTFVKWGCSPLRVRAGELTSEEKVAKMEQFEEMRGPMSDYRYVQILFDDVQIGPRFSTMTAMDRVN